MVNLSTAFKLSNGFVPNFRGTSLPSMGALMVDPSSGRYAGSQRSFPLGRPGKPRIVLGWSGGRRLASEIQTAFARRQCCAGRRPGRRGLVQLRVGSDKPRCNSFGGFVQMTTNHRAAAKPNRLAQFRGLAHHHKRPKRSSCASRHGTKTLSAV